MEGDRRARHSVFRKSARIEAARHARHDKHPSFRRLLAALVVSSFGTQGALAAKLGCAPSKLSRYMTGMHRGKSIQQIQLNSIHSDLVRSLDRAKLPSTEALWLSVQSGVQPAAPSPPPQEPEPKPVPIAKRAMPLFLVDVCDRAQKKGGRVHVMALGTTPAATDTRWAFPCPARGDDPRNRLLRVRFGLRARITFGVGVRGLGGRTFEWEVQKIDDELEFAHDGGPLWVGWELTGTVQGLLKEPIIGRKLGKGSGRHTGPSSPALILRGSGNSY